MPDDRQEVIDRLLKQTEEDEKNGDVLDELVYDVKCREGSDVNNGGFREQIEFLLRSGITEADIRRSLTGGE